MFKQIGTAVALAVILLASTITEADAATFNSSTVQHFRASEMKTQAREQFRLCVMHRESRGNYRAQNPTSSAQGAYQFLDNQWRRGLSFMVSKELRKTGEYTKGTQKWLVSHPIKEWPPHYQDVAFAAVIRAGGAHHWTLAGSKCQPLMRKVQREG